jgi:hypothetical protein
MPLSVVMRLKPLWPCSIRIAVTAAQLALVVVRHRRLHLSAVPHFRESLDKPPFPIGGRYGRDFVSLRSTRTGTHLTKTMLQ